MPVDAQEPPFRVTGVLVRIAENDRGWPIKHQRMKCSLAAAIFECKVAESLERQRRSMFSLASTTIKARTENEVNVTAETVDFRRVSRVNEFWYGSIAILATRQSLVEFRETAK